MKLYLIFLAVISVLASCGSFNSRPGDPIAKVHDQYLYREDLAGMFPVDINSADSVKLARNYIDKWIRNQLFLRLAEINLPEEEMNLEKQINDFRSSLLIYKYQQHLINQKLDSIVPLEELEEYYEDNSNNFILDRPAIRGVYLMVPANAPDKNRLPGWFRNGNDLVQIENYTSEHAVNYAWFSEDWVYLDDILKEFPPGSISQDRNISGTDFITTEDDNYHYFLGILDYRPSRSSMPFSLASNKIRDIILNRRKIEFLNELEKNVLTEGLSKNVYQYF